MAIDSDSEQVSQKLSYRCSNEGQMSENSLEQQLQMEDAH
jgi:hypothetical protein